MSASPYLLCMSLLICAALPCAAQEMMEIKALSESLAENGNETEDLSELTAQLDFLIRHPLNLNRTSPEELKKLPFLSSLQISNFFSHLASNGKLLDLLELQAIDGFDLETINRLLPFVTLTPATAFSSFNFRKAYEHGNHNLILRYSRIPEQQKGFKALPGSRYLGNAGKGLFRYRYFYEDVLSASLVMEKDAGERLFNGKPGVDFLSGHISIARLQKLKRLVIGDFSLQFGQGLTLWSGFAFGKGPDVTSVASKDPGLRSYTSSNESSFFRGIGNTIQLSPRLELTSFASFRKLDASLKTDTDGQVTVMTIGKSGLHRTPAELRNRKTLGQQVYGTVLQYTNGQLTLGLIAYQSHYEHSFITGTQKYKQYAFKGKDLSNAGFHYNYTFHNIYFFGEAANSIGTGWAIINGAMASISAKVSAVVVHRHYDKNYHNFFSKAMGEGSETNNEKGWYTGLNYMPHKHWKFSVYLDYFKFPWLKYRIDAASSGYELLSQLNYMPRKTFKITARFKTEHKQQNPDADSKANPIEGLRKSSYRLEWNWQLNKKFSFQQRMEMSLYQKGNKQQENGYLIYQDIAYKPLSSLLSGNVRLAYFNTSSYNSRIYAYEDDVLYASGSGSYQNKGIRGYLNLSYRLFKNLDIWGRYAITGYKGQESIGSGLDEIEGKKKSELKFQLRYQF